jgi:hypothetical protein
VGFGDEKVGAARHSRGMSFLPDPTELDAIAERISGHAAAARARAFDLGCAVAAADWRGVAASAFYGEAHVVVAALRSAAGRLDEAADALRRHARRVSVLYEDVKNLGLDSLQTAEDLIVRPDHLLSDGRRLFSDGMDLLDDALSLVGL